MAKQPAKNADHTSAVEADPARGAPPGDDARGVDEILDGLEAVVHELEAGDLPLERALERFEEGVRLARHGRRLLDAVEQRVERLLADRDETVPFSPEEER